MPFDLIEKDYSPFAIHFNIEKKEWMVLKKLVAN